MRKLISKRQSGRTTKLLYTSHLLGYPILVANEERARFLISFAREKDLTIPEPITVYDCYSHSIVGTSKYAKEILIDDAEDVLASLLHVFGCNFEIKAITMDSEGMVM